MLFKFSYLCALLSRLDRPTVAGFAPDQLLPSVTCVGWSDWVVCVCVRIHGCVVLSGPSREHLRLRNTCQTAWLQSTHALYIDSCSQSRSYPSVTVLWRDPSHPVMAGQHQDTLLFRLKLLVEAYAAPSTRSTRSLYWDIWFHNASLVMCVLKSTLTTCYLPSSGALLWLIATKSKIWCSEY